MKKDFNLKKLLFLMELRITNFLNDLDIKITDPCNKKEDFF